MKKHICKFSNWDLGHCMKWVCFTKCILCLWTFVFGSKFYPLDRNLRVMSDVKISMLSHNILFPNDNMKIFVCSYGISMLLVQFHYKYCNPIRHYDTNNAILAMTFPLNKKNWFVAWAIFQSLVHFFHFLKHLSLMLFFARIDLFN